MNQQVGLLTVNNAERAYTYISELSACQQHAHLFRNVSPLEIA